MFKLFFLFASMFTVVSSDNLRGRQSEHELTFMAESVEWDQFSNFRERFNKRYESIEELVYQVLQLHLSWLYFHSYPLLEAQMYF